MKRNILKCFALVLALFAISSNVSAQLVWDGTSSPWTHGTGTANDPYLIETPQNLAWLSDMVNNGISNYSGVYFKQTEDFNMNGNNYQFNVIGSLTNGGTIFSGHYDGNFKSISNLVISDLSPYVGLFGRAQNATLKRICLKGIRGSGSSSNKIFVGAICGYANNDTIIQCSCIGDVVLTETSANSQLLKIGGLVGHDDCSIIEQCYMRGNVKSARYYTWCYIGGLVGCASGPTTNTDDYPIKSCYFIGNVIVTGNSNSGNVMGLLVGYLGLINVNVSTYFSMSHCYTIGGFTRPSNYTTDDVMIGYKNGYANVTSSFNSYCGTNLPTTSSYATNRTDVYMKSAAMPALLNSGLDSTVYYFDYDTVNGGYPIFGYQQIVRYYTITANCDASMGNVTGMGSYASGSTATLQAAAAEGYIFSGWSDGNIENPRTVTVSSDSTYNAIFTKNAYTIHVKQNCSVEVE